MQTFIVSSGGNPSSPCVDFIWITRLVDCRDTLFRCHGVFIYQFIYLFFHLKEIRQNFKRFNEVEKVTLDTFPLHVNENPKRD